MQQPPTNYFRKRPKDNPSESNEPQRPYDFETDDPYMVENVSTTWTEEFEVIEPELTGIDFTPRYYFHFVLSHMLRTTFGDALGVPDNSDFGDNLDNLLEAEDNETDADVMTSPLWVYLTRECNRVRAGDLDTAIKKGQFWIMYLMTRQVFYVKVWPRVLFLLRICFTITRSSSLIRVSCILKCHYVAQLATDMTLASKVG